MAPKAVFSVTPHKGIAMKIDFLIVTVLLALVAPLSQAQETSTDPVTNAAEVADHERGGVRIGAVR